MKQLTIRGFDDELSECVRREAEQEGVSLSEAAFRLLRRGAGLPTAKARQDDKRSLLDDNSGPSGIAPDTLSRLARLHREERGRVLLSASILVDVDETEAWDSTLNDGLD